MGKILMSVILFFGLGASVVFARPTAKITLKTTDEAGAAVEGAEVVIGFVIPAHKGIGTTEIHKKGQTDSNGEFSTSSGSMNRLGFTIDKKGYYQSGASYEFSDHSFLLNRWEPWNPTVEVVLKKKRNPVPMYVKGGIIQVPVFDKPIGYDLETGDWVVPYGGGLISDFLITFHADMRAYRDYECSFVLKFSNPHDGIQEYYFSTNEQSYYKWPYVAPKDNYANKLSRHEKKLPGKSLDTDAKKKANYIFRVRTKVDDEGKIIEAKYGKIEGEFGFDPKGNMQFHYFFNPDGTRNLEEDPDKNLFDMK